MESINMDVINKEIDLNSIIDLDDIPIGDIDSDIEENTLKSNQYPLKLSLRIKAFENESEYNKFTKNCEKLIRGSNEYKEWRQYITDVLNINYCAITKENREACTVEIHHHIPSLYSVVKSIINKNIDGGIEFCTFDICSECIQLHYQNKIGYVALISSMHEKFHNNLLRIPRELILGNYMEFLKDYSKYLDDDDNNIINERLSISKFDQEWHRNDYPGLK